MVKFFMSLLGVLFMAMVSVKAETNVISDPPIARPAVAIGEAIQTENYGKSFGGFEFARQDKINFGTLIKEDARGYLKPDLKVLTKGWCGFNTPPYVIAKNLIKPEVVGWTTPQYVIVFPLIASYSNSGKLFREVGVLQSVLKKLGLKIPEERIDYGKKQDDAIIILGSPTVIDARTGEDVDYGFIWESIQVRYRRSYEKSFSIESSSLFNRLFKGNGVQSRTTGNSRPLYVTAVTLHEAMKQAAPQIRRIAQAIASIPEEDD